MGAQASHMQEIEQLFLQAVTLSGQARVRFLREECRHTALAGCDASNEAEDCDGPDDDEEWPDGRGIWIPEGQVRRKLPANQDFRKLAGVPKLVKLDH